MPGGQDAPLCRGAATRNTGEACSRLAKLEPGLPNQLSNLKLAIGLRNRIIHGYDAVDDEIVYQTVKEDLPLLKTELGDLLNDRASG